MCFIDFLPDTNDSICLQNQTDTNKNFRCLPYFGEISHKISNMF
jgi:hypothetical protein